MDRGLWILYSRVMDRWVAVSIHPYLHDVLDERGPAGQLVRLLADPLLAISFLGLLGGGDLRTTAVVVVTPPPIARWSLRSAS